MKYNDNELKLIFVLKIGYNTEGEGIYEFVFSLNEANIDFESWCWDISPACDNAMPPTNDFYDAIYKLKTKSFNLFCLHEAVDREYMHGYHTIHALAYETEILEDEGTYETMFDKSEIDEDMPLLVFHYGMTLETIKEMLNERHLILKGNEFIETSSIRFD